MVHLATLVHDDVMDEAEIRRGRLTLGANWGNEIAVLFGDCLFAQSLKLAASFPTPEICRAVAMSTNTVCTGEILQTRQRRNFQLTEPEYFKVLEMKTAELFALSCDLGACLANGSAEERALLHEYGTNLGIAYQIYDDCLDLFGTEAATGKSLGTDLAKGKLTLPVLRCLKRATSAERKHLEEILMKWETKSLPTVLEYLSKYDTLTESIEMIHSYLSKSMGSVSRLSNGGEAKCLVGLAQYLAHQTDKLGFCAKS
jgi:octaprenyl-diphosphate synthase